MPRTPRTLCALLVAASAAAALASPPCGAKDLQGRLAVGVEQTLAGTSGVAVRYFLTEGLGLTSTVGLDLAFVDDVDAVATGFTGSVGLLAHFARSLHAHLAFGARATVGWRNLASRQLADPDATASDLQLALEFPLALEFFLSDHFSVSAATGVLITFVPDSGATLPTSGHGGTRSPGAVGVGVGAGSVSTLAVLYYF